MITLSNKLLQYDEIDEGNRIFKFYLAGDIISVLNKIKQKGLFYILTPHEEEVLEKAERYYKENSELLYTEVC